jgi:hypothetical protein
MEEGRQICQIVCVQNHYFDPDGVFTSAIPLPDELRRPPP